jgi:ABC-type amino acid transport substrate-binding protein
MSSVAYCSIGLHHLLFQYGNLVYLTILKFTLMKLILSGVLLVVTSSLFSQNYQGDSWAKVKSSGSGTLAIIYYEQQGLIFEEQGKVKGACADIIDDFVAFVQEKYNKKITVRYAGKEPVFSKFLATAQNTKDLLGVTNVTITEERKKSLKFTPPFLTNPVVLITHKDAPTVLSFSELDTKLKGYQAEVVGGSTHVQLAERIKRENMPDLSISYGSNGPEILKKISANPKLFTILDFTEYVDATRKSLPVKKQNLAFGASQEMAFVMSKQSDWDDIWKEFLTPDYRKSVKYRKIIADNLGATFLSIVK